MDMPSFTYTLDSMVAPGATGSPAGAPSGKWVAHPARMAQAPIQHLMVGCRMGAQHPTIWCWMGAYPFHVGWAARFFGGGAHQPSWLGAGWSPRCGNLKEDH